MKRFYALPFLLHFLLPFIACAQLSEDFSDGNFNQGTLWQGDMNNFKVNSNQQLQLGSSGEGCSFLSTSIDGNLILEWNIWVKLSFSPSDNNQALIYLTSDNPDLTLPLNGYYIKLGETGSGDAIELYRQHLNEHILIARGTDGMLNDAFAIRIKVTRDDGYWQIFADPTGSTNFQLEATANEEYWQAYSFFGLLCRYTSSNTTKFYFDDIYAGPLNIDSEPPYLLKLNLTGETGIDLFFNESIQPTSSQQVSNYTVNNDFGTPLAAGNGPTDYSLVHLLFQDNFVEDKEYELSINNLKDLAGNTIQPIVIPFTYHPIKTFEIVFNEIMADPNPQVELPDCEYLELYNRAPFEVTLKDWQLYLGDTEKNLPEIILPSLGYHLLTGAGNDSLLNSYGNVTVIPGFTLSNTGTLLTLKDNNGAVIHSVFYDESWYHDVMKENGGWSLELVDPDNPCGAYDNWKASICREGGTPGKINSVNSPNPDSINPYIEYIASAGNSSITVFFNEIMDTIDIKNPLNYISDHDLGSPVDVKLNPPFYNSATLFFDRPFIDNTIYSLTINTKLRDCSGNDLSGILTSSFGLSQKVINNDLIINELLYEPRSTGEEFIEIYNRSSKIIELKDLWIAERDANSGEFNNPIPIAVQGRLIFPGDFIVLTKNPELVKLEYFTPNPRSFIKMESLPALSNSGGTIAVVDTEVEVIDEFTYSDQLHFALLNTTKGVSLERIDYNRPTNESNNWHSAGQNVGFASPGYYNSQSRLSEASGDVVSIEPQTFSPDNDGYNDILTIACQFEQPGYLVSIRIFDSNGRFVRLIAGNYLAGAFSNFNWDGINFKGEKAPTGIYVIYTEIFNLTGEVKRFKDVAVIAGF